MRNAIFMAAALVAVTAVYLYLAPATRPGQRVPAAVTLPIPPQSPDAAWVAGDAETIAADSDDGTEVVLGLRVRKDRNCTVQLRDYVTPGGEMFSAYSCTPDEPRPEHPYSQYDDATLEAMAYADAEAAAILGQRLIGRNTEKSYELLVRATALDGDTGHLYWLADQAFSAVKINDDIQVPNVMRRYELAALAAQLGASDVNSIFWRAQLVNAGVDNERLRQLDRRVDELLQTVRDIQVTVFGEVRHGGQGDA
jgi:hypothetical protein